MPVSGLVAVVVFVATLGVGLESQAEKLFDSKPSLKSCAALTEETKKLQKATIKSDKAIKMNVSFFF